MHSLRQLLDFTDLIFSVAFRKDSFSNLQKEIKEYSKRQKGLRNFCHFLRLQTTLADWHLEFHYLDEKSDANHIVTI